MEGQVLSFGAMLITSLSSSTNKPAEDGAPEVAHHLWPDRVDGNDS